MVSDIWLRTILIVRKETRCRHIGYSFWLTARVLLYAPSHRQDSTYHSFCYTSRGALAGTRNSSMGPPHEGSIRQPIAPWANTLTTELHLAPHFKYGRDKTEVISSYWSLFRNVIHGNVYLSCFYQLTYFLYKFLIYSLNKCLICLSDLTTNCVIYWFHNLAQCDVHFSVGGIQKAVICGLCLGNTEVYYDCVRVVYCFANLFQIAAADQWWPGRLVF